MKESGLPKEQVQEQAKNKCFFKPFPLTQPPCSDAVVNSTFNTVERQVTCPYGHQREHGGCLVCWRDELPSVRSPFIGHHFPPLQAKKTITRLQSSRGGRNAGSVTKGSARSDGKEENSSFLLSLALPLTLLILIGTLRSNDATATRTSKKKKISKAKQQLCTSITLFFSTFFFPF